MEVVQVNKEVIEGDQICSKNYRFLQIGQAVPIEAPDDDAEDSLYDSQNPPSLPMAVSERFRLLFVAHSTGFYVARTKEVLAAAEEFKEKGSGPSIQELRIINLSIGRVSILVLSSLDSWLAASVDNRIHFFSMSALLHKEIEPSFSVDLDDSSCIKDVKWARKVEKDYVVLSSTGKLYQGLGLDSLENVLVDVDAFEWSPSGDFIAVARKNVLCIMTPKFKEKLRFSLQSASLVVDSIRWVRADRIVLGCFELGDDSEVANYLVQVVTAHGNDITDTSSEPAVVSFPDIFLDYRHDIVPGAAGPNMFLGYLENHELAIIANRRNLSQHVVLLGWMSEEKNSGAAMIEIPNDAWCVHIESQGNGDDNLILALSVDKVSQNVGMKFILGEEEKEVSPCCILLCITIDGKLSVFHFASAGGAVDSRQAPADGDSLDGERLQVPSEQRLSGNSSEVTKQNVMNVSLRLELDKSSRIEPDNIQGNNVQGEDNSTFPYIKKNKPKEQSRIGTQDQTSAVSFQTLKSSDDQTFSFTKSKESRGTQESKLDERPSLKSEYSPFMTSHLTGSEMEARDPCETDRPAILEVMPHTVSSSEKVSNDFFSQSVSKSIQASVCQSPSRLKDTSSSAVRLSLLGQKGATVVENKSTPLAGGDSQVSLQENLMSRKSSIPELNEENFTTTSHPQWSNHEQKLSIQFSNVEVLVKKMDQLLKAIGGVGGFKDASITSQEGSVATLEAGLWMMSERYRTWRGTLEERLKDIQLLLGKTLQVLARKAYIEGILRQVTDDWYSDLWNSQNLSLELELKRRHIVEVDQELASQLVQLERHFNTIELNKFGESGAVQKNQKLIRSGHGKPRQQSLRTLQNTMSAQLSAAEKLSECLGKQMAALSNPRDSKQNVKREVFETLGLTYDGASYNSSVKEKALDSPRKNLQINSSSLTAKEQCRKTLSTPVKNCEPQTVRRRRDSLDQMRSSAVPIKTTVRRKLLQEEHGGFESRLPTEVKEQHLGLELLEESTPAKSVFQYKTNAKMVVKKSRDHSSIPLSHWAHELADPGIEVVSTRNSPAFLEHSMSPASARLNSARENHTFLPAKYAASGKTSGTDSRYVQQSQKLSSVGQSIAERTPAVSSGPFKNFFESRSFSNEELGQPTPTRSGSSLPEFNLNHKFSVSSGPISSSPHSSGKVLDSEIPTGETHPGKKMSSATDQFGSSAASFSEPSVEMKSHATSSGHKSSSAAKLDKDQKLLPSHLLFSSSSMSSLSSPEMDSLSSTAASLINENSESQESGSQRLLDVSVSNKDESLAAQTMISNSSLAREEICKAEASVLQPGLSTGNSALRIGPQPPSTSGTKLPAILSSDENQHNIGSLSSPASEMAPNSLLGQPWLSRNNSPGIFSGSSLGGKDLSSSVNNVDEMEEEAPEGSLTTELSLGDLGGFGFGSPSTSPVMKPNPFGVEMLNKTTATVSSQLQMPTPPGELFRPASFSFQSPLPSQPSIAASGGLFSSGFSTGSSTLGPSSSGFGQPAQFGSGQQALGSVLGAFGQSRQLGTSQHGNTIAPPSGFGSGLSGSPSGGFGFAAAAMPGGGFAAAAKPVVGFTGGGGFAGAATGGGGFAAAAGATVAGGVFSGGFGAFSNQGGGSYSAYSSSSVAGRPPSDLFTQMRK